MEGEGEASVPQRNTKGVKKGRVASDRSFSGAEHPLVACDLPSIGSQPLRARSKDHGAILTLPPSNNQSSISLSPAEFVPAITRLYQYLISSPLLHSSSPRPPSNWIFPFSKRIANSCFHDSVVIVANALIKKRKRKKGIDFTSFSFFLPPFTFVRGYKNLAVKFPWTLGWINCRRRNNFANTNYFNVTTCCTPNQRIRARNDFLRIDYGEFLILLRANEIPPN